VEIRFPNRGGVLLTTNKLEKFRALV